MNESSARGRLCLVSCAITFEQCPAPLLRAVGWRYALCPVAAAPACEIFFEFFTLADANILFNGLKNGGRMGRPMVRTRARNSLLLELEGL